MRPAVEANMSKLKFESNGAIAQLGERYTGSVEVSGSIPLSSTRFGNKRDKS
jgi:hypothetical protein